MVTRFRSLARLWSDRSGITALEYGIVAGWLAFVVVIAFTTLGSGVTQLIGGVTKSL